MRFKMLFSEGFQPQYVLISLKNWRYFIKGWGHFINQWFLGDIKFFNSTFKRKKVMYPDGTFDYVI